MLAPISFDPGSPACYIPRLHGLPKLLFAALTPWYRSGFSVALAVTTEPLANMTSYAMTFWLTQPYSLDRWERPPMSESVYLIACFNKSSTESSFD